MLALSSLAKKDLVDSECIGAYTDRASNVKKGFSVLVYLYCDLYSQAFAIYVSFNIYYILLCRVDY